MPYTYRQAAGAWGDQFRNDYSRQQFRRLRSEQGNKGVGGYLANQYNPPPAYNGPGDGAIPSPAPFNPFSNFGPGGDKVNIRNMFGLLGDYYNTAYGNQEQYRDALNKLFGDIQGSSLWQTVTNPETYADLRKPVISDELLAQNIARSNDRLAMNENAIEGELGARFGASGQRPGAMLPALAGAKYMHSFNTASEENRLRNEAALANRQGLLQGVEAQSQALQSMLGLTAQQVQAMKDMAGSDERFWLMAMTLLGGAMSKRKY